MLNIFFCQRGPLTHGHAESRAVINKFRFKIGILNQLFCLLGGGFIFE